ncbi:GumC family protein [Jiella sonneratiae]|uniref:GumC family protein n=1 Tax=Jiella sonneratiae TaxID=2816856 RepID=A0ABS3J331_9HYPH|nr:GumC family protein [Jiella sonneratiae]MBO0904069.1 GumC family protein [Jiella sonneratiae]
MFARAGSQSSPRRPFAPDAPVRVAPAPARAPASGPLFDPLQVVAEIWSLKWLVILLTLLGIAAGVLLALSTPHKYTAVTEVLIDPRDIKVVQNEVTPNGLPSDATLALIESQISVIYSNEVLNRVIDKGDLADDPEFNGKAKGLFAPLLALFEGKEDAEAARRRHLMTLNALREAMSVTRDPKSFVLNVSITSRSPDKSAKLANLVTDSFIEQLAQVQSDTARRASDALSSRLAELRERVVDAERAVESYKSEHRLVGVGGRLVDDDYLVRINDQLAKARGEMTGLRVRAEQMKKASVDDVVKGTLPEELTSETLARLRNTYTDLAQQNATLAATLGPRHPRRIAAEDALKSVRDAIRQELERIVAAAQTDLARAERTDKDLTAQVSDLKDKQLETSASFVRLRELEREVDASRAVYEAFLLRARETGEQERLNTANVRVISSANPPLNPSSTSRKVIVLAATIAGFVLGFALAAAIAGIKLLRRSLRSARPTVAWASDAGALVPAATTYPEETTAAVPTVAAAAAQATAKATDDLSDAVRPTVHVAPERLRRRAPEGAFRQRDPMADRVVLAEAVLDAALPKPVVAASRDADAPPAQPEGEVLTRVRPAEPAPRALPARSRPEREELRERLRAIAEAAHFDEAIDPNSRYTVYNEDIARLQDDILAVKRNLAAARSRRAPQGTPPAG